MTEAFTTGQTVFWVDQNGVQRYGVYIGMADARLAQVEGNGATKGMRTIASRHLNCDRDGLIALPFG